MVAIRVVISGHTAVPRYRVTRWLYSGYSCIATTCGLVRNSPWQQPLVLTLHNKWPTMKFLMHKIQTPSLFLMGYHGRYRQLVWKLACHPKLQFQIPCTMVLPAILCLCWLLLARRKGWRASLSNRVGSALFFRASKTLLTHKWVIYYLRLMEMMPSFVLVNCMGCSWFIVHQQPTTFNWS